LKPITEVYCERGFTTTPPIPFYKLVLRNAFRFGVIRPARWQSDRGCDSEFLFQSNNDEELSEAELPDEDSEDTLSRLPVEDVGDPEVLAKLKQQVCTHIIIISTVQGI
jgi:hypothetical protein